MAEQTGVPMLAPVLLREPLLVPQERHGPALWKRNESREVIGYYPWDGLRSSRGRMDAGVMSGLEEEFGDIGDSIMRRIIHLSDLHVGAEEIDDRFQTVIERLIREEGDRAGEYVLVITGDLVDDANHGQYADEVSQGLDELGRVGFDQILIIPGNHDYGDGSDGDARFVEPFKLRFYGRALSYPKVDVIEGVAFLGLDSMAEELHWYDHLFAEGELGELQLQRLAGALRRDDVLNADRRVVYLHHHPFDSYPFHGLKDASGLRRVLEDAAAAGSAVDALLYGHNHLGRDRNGEWGIPRCYDAGSATLEPGLKVARVLGIHQTRACTRVINLGTDPSSDTVLDLV